MYNFYCVFFLKWQLYIESRALTGLLRGERSLVKRCTKHLSKVWNCWLAILYVFSYLPGLSYIHAITYFKIIINVTKNAIYVSCTSFLIRCISFYLYISSDYRKNTEIIFKVYFVFKWHATYISRSKHIM